MYTYTCVRCVGDVVVCPEEGMVVSIACMVVRCEVCVCVCVCVLGACVLRVFLSVWKGWCFCEGFGYMQHHYHRHVCPHAQNAVPYMLCISRLYLLLQERTALMPCGSLIPSAELVQLLQGARWDHEISWARRPRSSG